MKRDAAPLPPCTVVAAVRALDRASRVAQADRVDAGFDAYFNCYLYFGLTCS